jgi:hypothetical protein
LAEFLSVLEIFESSLTDDSGFVGPDVLAADSVVAPAPPTVEAEPEFVCVVSIESFAMLEAPLDADGKLLASVFTTEPAFPSALTLLLCDG